MQTQFERILNQLKNNDKNLVKLDFWRNKIIEIGDNGDDGMIALAEVLEKNTSLTTLQLYFNKIHENGTIALAEVLEKNTSLTTLELRYNEIGDNGAITLAAALAKNTSLTTLGFCYNEIGDNGAIALAEALAKNTSLTRLKLTNNTIGKKGAIALAEALEKNTSLTTLDLRYNKIGDNGAIALATAFAKNTSLTTLNFECNQIYFVGAIALAKALKKNTSLTTLDLGGNSIGLDGAIAVAKALKKNTSLTTLDLSYNEIGDDGATALAEALENNARLTDLNLSENGIDNVGAIALAEALKKNTSLTGLHLWDNSIGKDGMQGLAKALEKNTSLTTIDLHANNIGDKGAEYLAKALEKNTDLTMVFLQGNNIGDEGQEHLDAAARKNYSLLELGCMEQSLYSQYHKTRLLNINIEIADCIQPLNDAIKKSLPLDDGQTIEATLSELQELLPELDRLPQDSYPVEAYRLLTAMGHMTALDEKAKVHALTALFPPFKHHSFQQMANKSLGLLLSGDLAISLKEKNLEKEGLLLSLYGFRNHLHEPEIKIFANIALFKLMFGKGCTLEQNQSFEENNAILTQNKLLSLLEKTHTHLKENKPDSQETLLIEDLVRSKACYVFSLPTACQSEAFIACFKTQYPKAKTVTTIEHCLLSALNNRSNFLMEITEPNRAISEDHIAKYYWRLMKNKTNALPDVVEALKQLLEKQLTAQDEAGDRMSKKRTISEVIQNSTRKKQKTLTSSSASGFFKPSVIKNESEPVFSFLILQIARFCNRPCNEVVDGLVKIKVIAEDGELNDAAKITQVIALAKEQKSDNNSNELTFQDFFGSSNNPNTEVKCFYQNLAALDLTNLESLIAFANHPGTGWGR